MRNAVRIAIVIVLAWALIRLGGVRLDALKWVFTHPLPIAAAVLCVWLNLLLIARRLQIILAQQVEGIGFASVLSVACAAQFTGNLLLGTVGGDGVKLGLLSSRGSASVTRLVVAVVLDRMLGLLALVAIGLAALMLRADLLLASPFLRWLAVCAGAAFAAMLVAGFAARAPALRRLFQWSIRQAGQRRIGKVLQALADSVELASRDPRTILRGLALSLLANLLPILGFFVVASGVPGMTLTLGGFSFALPIAQLANSLAITPGGLGVGEGAFDLLARLVAGHPEVGFASLFLSFRIISIFATLPGIVPLLRSIRTRVAKDGELPVAASKWRSGVKITPNG